MSFKTPEQITDDVLARLDLGEGTEGQLKSDDDLTDAFRSGWLSGDTVRNLMEGAIQADRAQHRAAVGSGLGEVIGFMAEDRSNNWSEEIRTLEAVERELESLEQRVSAYQFALGKVENVEDTSRYARLGEFVAVLMGSNTQWDSPADYLATISEAWGQLGAEHAIGDQSNADLAYWRPMADTLGIAHDDEQSLYVVHPDEERA